ncbi:hypothetical protein PsorP6_005995 [Peronosclerospora sorghi]|uniref:Uncharacterized protein n=1 Tax=Peronosclerospora sorghi TaxID=230839 RepID=A0ACC0W6C7_9STRA|nr:hypothetical protein PsorP6_005995 [Peronosclerospora sorghi]
MTQRDLLKGRVKRLLKDQKDMGQLGDSAVLCCASVLRIFVKDLASQVQKQAAGGRGLTPIELYGFGCKDAAMKGVLASVDLSFLHEKVMAIDESTARYHKHARSQKRKKPEPAAIRPKSSTKKARTTKAAATAKPARQTKATQATEVKPQKPTNEDLTAPSASVRASAIKKRAQPLLIEEDDNYDESDSDA